MATRVCEGRMRNTHTNTDIRTRRYTSRIHPDALVEPTTESERALIIRGPVSR